MSDAELLKFIEEIEKDSLHKAPDYLKEMTLTKAQKSEIKVKKSKTEQLFAYQVRVFAAMAASLILLLAIPQPEPRQETADPSIMRTVYMKSNELVDFLNQFSNDLVVKEDY